ncbi:hypothetical protein D3C75_574760 [compost metagenome]
MLNFKAEESSQYQRRVKLLSIQNAVPEVHYDSADWINGIAWAVLRNKETRMAIQTRIG